MNNNSLEAKQINRTRRHAQKREAAKRIPHLGVRVAASLVRQHQYLKSKGLAHSPSVASVPLPSRQQRLSERNLQMEVGRARNTLINALQSKVRDFAQALRQFKQP